MPFVKYKGVNGEWIKLGGGNVRVSNGHNWIPPRARIWTGSEWKNLLDDRHVDTWECTGVQSFWSWGAAKGWSALVRPDRPTQGCYRPYHDSYDWGDESAQIYFDWGNIQNTLRGAKIEKVEIYMHCLHSMNYNGGQGVFGLHNAPGWQSKYSETNFGVARAWYNRRDQGQWITLPNWVGDNFRDGSVKGITCRAGDTAGVRYLWYAGSADGWKKPKIRITYWK